MHEKLEYFDELCQEYNEQMDAAHPSYSFINAYFSRLVFPSALSNALLEYPTATNPETAIFNIYKAYFETPTQLICCIPFWSRFELILEQVNPLLAQLEADRLLTSTENAFCATALFFNDSSEVVNLLKIFIQLGSCDQIELLRTEDNLGSKFHILRFLTELKYSLDERRALLVPILKHKDTALILWILGVVHSLNNRERTLRVNIQELLMKPVGILEFIRNELAASPEEMTQECLDRLLAEGPVCIEIPKMKLSALTHCSIFNSPQEEADEFGLSIRRENSTVFR